LEGCGLDSFVGATSVLVWKYENGRQESKYSKQFSN